MIYLAMIILKGWEVFHGDIFKHVSSSTPFLYNIREPKMNKK